MSAPIYGKSCVVKKGTTTIGFGREVRISVDADVVKEYVFGDDKPSVLTSGNKTFRADISMLFIDGTYINDILNGTTVAIEVQPQGTGAGKPKITLSDAVFYGYDFTAVPDGYVTERARAEGKSLTYGTQT
jgi:hypothetical protein